MSENRGASASIHVRLRGRSKERTVFCWNELEIPEDGDDDGLKAVRRRKEKSWSVSRTNGIPPLIDRLSPHAFDYLTFKTVH